ncbi:MAG: hypothetical protein LZF85_00305 [Nitrosomonas sp.]|uniref:Imm57 family immunity protein n=1 Tax=Nitrosomonas sp. TaxID=42353 RepID=UPI0025EE01F2|nr:Imm57 family immunity protein [Nitrosomonas sp.]UJP02944.1 MAG: hypothetical protein LZF85_00305 [Nitrosomonas sp.]
MKKKTIFLVCLLSFVPYFTHAEEKTRDQRENEMAESAIFWTLASKDAADDIQAELGLIVIGVKNSADALKRLVKLMRYRMDAGLSEDYTCYVLDKGKEVLTYLEGVRPDELVKQCQLEFESRKHQNRQFFEKVQSSNVCSSSMQIKERAQFFVEGILSGQRCANGDF